MMRPLRLGMVGGGQGAFIGAVHRIAARMDGHFTLVAGALSSDPQRAQASAAQLGLARSYDDYATMAREEAARDDGIEAVAIVTPNHMHAGPAVAFLNAGIHVICDKPLAATQDDAALIAEAADVSDARFILTHNYSGYPLIRQAKRMVAAGELGAIRLVQAEYAQGWLAGPVEETGQKQASWRTDPAKSGAGGAIADIGTHAFHLMTYTTGLGVQAVSADLHHFGAGRQLDDNAHIMLRLGGGAKGMIWVSQVAVGHENGLRLRIYGETGALDWAQENPNRMRFSRIGEPCRILTRGGAGTGDDAALWTRTPPGHPEGYLEGFGNIYTDVAKLIRGEQIEDGLPGLREGLDGMRFIDACVQSSHADGRWQDFRADRVAIA